MPEIAHWGYLRWAVLKIMGTFVIDYMTAPNKVPK